MFFKYVVGDERPALIKLKLSVTQPNMNTPIIIPGIEILIDEESELKVECSEDNKKWIKLITKRILTGNVPIVLPPSVSPPPS
jgi:hypothetical protein